MTNCHDTWGTELVGRLIAGRYLLRDELGRGGMGVVFEADDILGDRTVAMKVLREGCLEGRVVQRRFLREVRAMLAVGRHSAEVYEVGIFDDHAFMVMERLHGVDLDGYLDDGLPCLTVALQIASYLAQSLEAAHGAGLVHRDLKPANVFLEGDGCDFRVRLLDFGVAKLRSIEGTVTTCGALLGTLPYMSPEQVEDASSVDERSDIWSFGVILFELLTGDIPYPDLAPGRLIRSILKEPLPRLGVLVPDLPPALEDLVMRCLDRDPAARPSANALLVELGSIADGLDPSSRDLAA